MVKFIQKIANHNHDTYDQNAQKTPKIYIQSVNIIANK